MHRLAPCLTPLCLVTALAVLLTGCQTPQCTAFAPLEMKLEPVAGGVRHFVLVNASKQDLHNLRGSVYVWNDKNLEMRRQYTRTGYVSEPLFKAGQVGRFESVELLREAPVDEAISAVEFVGHCDEGAIREAWRNSDTDQLQRVAAAPASPAARQP